MDEIDVIYVAGVGRSGSTILDRVLGTLDGVSSFNEIYRIFLEGFEENNLCACGERFRDCAFWTEVLRQTTSGEDDIRHLMDLHHAIDHSRHFLRLYYGMHNKDYAAKLDEYKQWLRKLYFTMAELSGNRIIVDSSKVPTRALILSDIPGINVHVVHLVRDVRAVVVAWQKQKFNPAAGHSLPLYTPWRTVKYWCTRNLFAGLLQRRAPYIRVVYEEFGKAPRQTVERIVDTLAPLRGKALKFVTDDSIELSSLHTIGGNPDRFTTGATQLRLDMSWVDKINPSSQRMATLVALPLLWQYGYLGRHSPKALLATSAT